MGQRKKVKRRPIGILDMLIAQAHDVPNRMPSNGPYTPRQDVYVQVFGGRTPSKQNLKTRKAKEGGSEPVFNETMQVCNFSLYFLHAFPFSFFQQYEVLWVEMEQTYYV